MLREGIDECHTENADTSSDEPRAIDAQDTKDLDVVVLKKELEEALGDLTEAKGREMGIWRRCNLCYVKLKHWIRKGRRCKFHLIRRSRSQLLREKS